MIRKREQFIEIPGLKYEKLPDDTIIEMILQFVDYVLDGDPDLCGHIASLQIANEKNMDYLVVLNHLEFYFNTNICSAKDYIFYKIKSQTRQEIKSDFINKFY